MADLPTVAEALEILRDIRARGETYPGYLNAVWTVLDEVERLQTQAQAIELAVGLGEHLVDRSGADPRWKTLSEVVADLVAEVERLREEVAARHIPDVPSSPSPAVRVGMLIRIARVSGVIGSPMVTQAAGMALLNAITDGVHPVGAAVGLLQLARVGTLYPRSQWERDVRAACSTAGVADPRIDREYMRSGIVHPVKP